jgi:hypothetical protein
LQPTIMSGSSLAISSWGFAVFFGGFTKFFGADLQSRIQRENIDISTGASPACKGRLSQYDINRRFSLAIRNNQVDPQTRHPTVLSGCIVLIKSTEIFQPADLCHGESPVNSCLRKVELDGVQGRWINNSFNLFHREIRTKSLDPFFEGSVCIAITGRASSFTAQRLNPPRTCYRTAR